MHSQCIAVAGAPINDDGWIHNEVFDLPLPYFNAHRQRLGMMTQGPFYVAASNNLILRMFSYILMLIIVVCRILIHECGPLICYYSLMAS